MSGESVGVVGSGRIGGAVARGPAQSGRRVLAHDDLGDALEFAQEVGVTAPGAERVRERIERVLGLVPVDGRAGSR